MASNTVPIQFPPELPELLSVEHPCFVVNADKAIHMLGGTETLAHACSASGTLHCHLRKDDPLSHPLYGELVSSRALLVKVTRKRARGAELASSADMHAEALGIVHQSYRFQGITDFQFSTSSELLASLRDPPPLITPNPAALAAALGEHALLIPPATFCNEDTPYNFLPLRPAVARREQRTAAKLTATTSAMDVPVRGKICRRLLLFFLLSSSFSSLLLLLTPLPSSSSCLLHLFTPPSHSSSSLLLLTPPPPSSSSLLLLTPPPYSSSRLLLTPPPHSS